MASKRTGFIIQQSALQDHTLEGVMEVMKDEATEVDPATDLRYVAHGGSPDAIAGTTGSRDAAWVFGTREEAEAKVAELLDALEGEEEFTVVEL